MSRVIVNGAVYVVAPRSPDYIPAVEEVIDFWKHSDSLWEYIIDLQYPLIQELKAEGHSEDEAKELAFQDKMDEWVESEIKSLYRGVVKELESWDRQEIWRAVNLYDDHNPKDLDPLGIYWADNPDAAYPHLGGGPNKTTHVFRATVDFEDISRFETVILRTDVLGEMEDEIRIKEGSEIWVHDVTLPDGTVLPINDWRRA